MDGKTFFSTSDLAFTCLLVSRWHSLLCWSHVLMYNGFWAKCWSHLFVFFPEFFSYISHTFPWIWISLGLFSCIFRRFAINCTVTVQYFFFFSVFLFTFNLFLFCVVLKITSFNVGLNLSFKEVWSICTNGKEPHVWIALWLGNIKLHCWWSCGSAD